jgi:hypothetical protein
MLAQYLTDPWLKDHQALVAAVIALAGTFLTVIALMGGYLLNASLNRRQLDRNRHQEAIALAAVLMAEVNAIRHQAGVLEEMFGMLLEQASKGSKDEIWEKLTIGYAGPFQFEKVSEKFGLLGPRLAFQVSNFYFMYLDVFGGLKTIPDENVKNSDIRTLLPVFRRGLKLVTEKGAEIVPELLAFSMSRRQREDDLKWFAEKAQENERRVVANTSFSKTEAASTAPSTSST